MNDKPLSNTYAKEYYDAQVGQLISYEQDRWHSSAVQEFEYHQTKRALEHALGNERYANAVEIGPGDAVWTSLLRKHVAGNIHLIEQSEEMLKRAQARAGSFGNITWERSDFLTAGRTEPAELVMAIRCFEYFDDKLAGLKKMRSLLTPGGKIIIITKNADLLTGQSVQGRRLHSGQLTQSGMRHLAADAGLTVVRSYPAVLRWKATWAPMRVLFDVLHRIAVATNGWVSVPVVTKYATESYVYVMRA